MRHPSRCNTNRQEHERNGHWTAADRIPTLNHRVFLGHVVRVDKAFPNGTNVTWNQATINIVAATALISSNFSRSGAAPRA